MLSELRRVRWHTALALVAGGALTAILLTMLFDDGGSAAEQTASGHRAADPAPRGHASAPATRSAGLAPTASERESESPAGAGASIPRLVGQRFMVGLRAPVPPQKLLQDARRGEIGGVVVFTEESSPADVRRAAAALQRAARAGGNPGLLIATDQEGGPVKRLPGPPSAALSTLSPGEALQEGSATGRYLRAHGINVDLAPVVDLGLPGSFMTEEGRTISSSPARVTAVAERFADGLEQTGVMPVAKHFPGLGEATQDSDREASVVDASIGKSLIPFRELIASSLPLGIMVSTAIYTKRDPDHGAAWSPRIVGGLLRHELGFDGLVISDDLSSEGVAQSLPTPKAVEESAKAGVDVLLLEPDSFRSAYEALLKAAEDGRIPRGNLDASYSRILDAKKRFAR